MPSDAAAAKPWWKRAFVWEVPFLAALAGFMFWVRMLPFNALIGSGRAYYIGTDPFYHYRETLGIVRSFPYVPRFDPWTFYPNGTTTGQFGSLLDWLSALIVVITQGKGASEAYVQVVTGYVTPVLGALIVIPLYYLAKRLLGTPGAIITAITIAFLPGEFLIRSVAGYFDHHVIEALCVVITMLGVYVAAMKGHAARDAIRSWRNVGGYWKAALFGVLGGVAVATNLYAWPPALLFVVVLAAWLTIVILLEDGKGGDGTGYAFGGSVAFLVAGLLMAPAVETTFLGEFNTYGLLHVLMPMAAAAWLWIVHLTSRATRARGWSPWVVPGIIVGLAAVLFILLATVLATTYASFLWGLSWVTGIGIRRTTLTIAEARQSEFFCTERTQDFSCLANDFGIAAPISIALLIALFVWVLVKRRPADILLLLWSFVAVRATQTQIRFSYYLAINIALLIGWAAARVSEAIGFETVAAPTPVAKTAPAKGRKTRRIEAPRERQWWQPLVIATVLFAVVPGNVLASSQSYPGWVSAKITAPDGDLVLWTEGLDWMRAHTPDAGVDLSAIVARPPPGTLYAYPPQSYGVISWWDYGHWIETIAQRPPVANPFQQAAPFASLYFTERDPNVAEKMLDDWVQGKGPVRYVWIDDAMATGKFGAITVWANSQNTSRDRWADGDYIKQADYSTPSGAKKFYTLGPEYRESMMGRLYDEDAIGLSHYRLAWEHAGYYALGSVSSAEGQIRCFHDTVPSRSCPVQIDSSEVSRYQRGTAVAVGDSFAYDLQPASPLKLFERVPGAHLVGTAAPGALVRAAARVDVMNGDSLLRAFTHEVSTTAGPDGHFDVVFPYSNTQMLGPKDGGTDLMTKIEGQIRIASGTLAAGVDVPDRAVLKGETVQVTLG